MGNQSKTYSEREILKHRARKHIRTHVGSSCTLPEVARIRLTPATLVVVWLRGYRDVWMKVNKSSVQLCMSDEQQDKRTENSKVNAERIKSTPLQVR